MPGFRYQVEANRLEVASRIEVQNLYKMHDRLHKVISSLLLRARFGSSHPVNDFSCNVSIQNMYVTIRPPKY